ncbi:pleckstrin homology domain-containing family G member 3-like [Trematomus bernacchii]|uniref:pleckstrin homology domain-containing family G member 3-like n=1 Tax=Trematomus bernacchii TaxID=40690 RepID=UPI00146BC626|nr:pleckstrin homology domain-containing family G member 3-like [Trematomus bernacchii]
MLIESAKDSLSFSVTHYRRPKQPHTVQAKSLEEKKLWAQNIKRIILENHQAIIPQKAKEAILEMDSIYPRRFRYSPDRPKNVLSESTPQGLVSSSSESTPQGLVSSSSESTPQGLVSSSSESTPQGLVSSSSESTPQGLVSSSSESTPQGLQSHAASKDADGGNREDDRLHEETCEQVLMTSLPVPLQTPTEENPDPEPPSGPDTSCRTSEDLNPERPDTPSSAPDPSSGESSEDEEEVKGGPEEGKTSILPSSVLDRASAIAQHFSIRRGSLARGQDQDQGQVRTLRLHSSCSGPSETFSPVDLNPASPRGNRRDSTLSQQDQMLIGKIRNYYENQDLSFKLQRRESLNYIPAGLVRTSVSRLNSTTDQQPNTESGPLTDQQTSIESAPPYDTLRVSSDSLGSIRSDQRSTDPGPEERSWSRSQSLQDEVFRPSSEMIQVWQAMEEEINRSTAKDLSPEESTRPGPCQTSAGTQTGGGAKLQDQTKTQLQDQTKNQLQDQTKNPLQGQTKNQTKDQTKNQLHDQTKTQLQDQTKTQLQDQTRAQLQDQTRAQLQDQTKNQLQDQTKNQLQGQTKDQTKTQLQDQTKNQLQDQTKNPLQGQTKNQTKDQTKNQLHDQTKTQLQDQTKTQLQDQTRAQLQDQTRAQLQDQTKNQLQDQTKNQLQGQTKDQTKNQLQDQTKNQLQDQTKNQLQGQTKDQTKNQLQDQTKSKVMHLARQYSQRIRTTKPEVWRLELESRICEDQEMPNAGEPLLGGPQVDRTRPVTPSSMVLSPAPPTEIFPWPDVRQLRSKYCDQVRPPPEDQRPEAGLRRPPPEDQRPEAGLRRRSSLAEETTSSRKPLQRARSLDPRSLNTRSLDPQSLDPPLSVEPQTDRGSNGGFFVAAEAPLPHDPEHRILVLEKGGGDSLVQSRSPTSREKISIMAVIDRCRVYQESQEGKDRANQNQNPGSDLVRNLRARFQSLSEGT